MILLLSVNWTLSRGNYNEVKILEKKNCERDQFSLKFDIAVLGLYYKQLYTSVIQSVCQYREH